MPPFRSVRLRLSLAPPFLCARCWAIFYSRATDLCQKHHFWSRSSFPPLPNCLNTASSPFLSLSTQACPGRLSEEKQHAAPRAVGGRLRRFTAEPPRREGRLSGRLPRERRVHKRCVSLRCELARGRLWHLCVPGPMPRAGPVRFRLVRLRGGLHRHSVRVGRFGRLPRTLLRARLVHRALCHSGRESGRELEEPVLVQAWLARRGMRRGHVPVALLRPWHVRQRQLLVHRGLAGRCLRRANKG